jgi:hypothetical protein
MVNTVKGKKWRRLPKINGKFMIFKAVVDGIQSIGENRTIGNWCEKRRDEGSRYTAAEEVH